MSETVLSIQAVTLSFGGVAALRDVSFDIGPDEILAVIGPNGAGKSSLLNVLSGIYRPQSGTVQFKGEDLLSVRVDKIAGRGLSRTFQNLGLFDTMTAVDNVLVGRSPRLRSGLLRGSLWWGPSRREEQEARAHALELLDLVGVEDAAGEPVGSMSYGTKKRVELAKALANDPDLLLLDEPVAGMNPEETARIGDAIEMVRRDLNTSVMIIEHDLPMVMKLADTVVVLDFGEVVAVGTPAEIQSDPNVLRAYTGDIDDDPHEPKGAKA